MNSLPQVVKFNNQDVPVFFQDEKPYVAMKPICENIGLDWVSQHKRIQRNHVLNSTMVIMTIVAQDGKKREMVTLPIGFLNGWLAGVDVNKVKPEIKPTLIKYQLECFDVLYKHFMPKVAEQHPNTITIEQQQAIKDAVLAKVHREGKHYQAVYHEFYREFNIPRYQELPLSKFDQAINWLNDGWYHYRKWENTEPHIMGVLHDKNVQFLMWYVPILAKFIKNEVHPALKAIQSDYAGHIYGLAQEAVCHANILNRKAIGYGIRLEHVNNRQPHSIEWYLKA